MISNVWNFIIALASHWVAAVTSGALALAISVIGVYLKKPRLQRTFLIILGFGILFASFEAWLDEHKVVASEHSALIRERDARKKIEAQYTQNEAQHKQAITELRQRQLPSTTLAFRTMTPEDVPLPPKRDGEKISLGIDGYYCGAALPSERVFATTRVGGNYYLVVENPIVGDRWHVNVYAPTEDIVVELYRARGEARRLFEEWETLVGPKQGEYPKYKLDDAMVKARAATFHYRCQR